MEWHSVNDRLPAADGDVLVWAYGSVMVAEYGPSEYHDTVYWYGEVGDSKVFYVQDIGPVTPSHWMALPDAPEE